MAIVGTGLTVVDDAEPEIVEKRKKAAERRKGEVYNGSELLSEGHFERIAALKKTQTARRQGIIEHILDIHKTAQNIPLQRATIEGDKNMLMVQRRSMAGKTITVGTVPVVFDEYGIGRLSRANLAAYKALTRQPGYSPYSPPTKAVIPGLSAPKPVKVIELVTEHTPAIEKEEVAEVIELVPELEPEPEVEEEDDFVDFGDYTKAELQAALYAVEVEYKNSENKSSLIAKLDDAWEDDELREIIFDTLMEED